MAFPNCRFCYVSLPKQCISSFFLINPSIKQIPCVDRQSFPLLSLSRNTRNMSYYHNTCSSYSYTKPQSQEIVPMDLDQPDELQSPTTQQQLCFADSCDIASFTSAASLAQQFSFNVAPVRKGCQAGKRLDFLQRLPYELAAYILSLLDLPTLTSVSMVSKHWYSLYRNCSDLWRQRMIELNWSVSLPSNVPSNQLDWYYLFRQKYQLEKRWTLGQVSSHSMMGHRDGVYCVQFDDEKIITGSRDRTIKVWDPNTFQCLATLQGHRGSVVSLKYNRDIMVSGSSDTTVVVWNMHTGKKVRRLKGHTAGISDVCFDDEYIVSSSKDGTIRVWDLVSGAPLRVLMGHRGPVNAVQLKGNRLISASSDTTIKLWDITTGACIRKFVGHKHGIACVKFDGLWIVSGSNDQTIKIWDVETGACIRTLEGHEGLVRSLQVDGDKIVSCGYDRTVRVWNARTGECLLNFQNGHSSWVFDVAFDKTRIVSAGLDQKILILDFAHGLDKRFLK